MSSALSKRQQARNERALQELIKSVPGNDKCADCQARNPGWASWSLGIFLCMRCATLHRKLGTHVSKVKSLSMDTWATDQVDNMKRNGNTAVNRIYNPRNLKPPIPLDVDEVDSAMERFIRQKYEQKILVDGKPRPPSRNDYEYPRSSDDSPPPLPPKKGKIFGFGLRAASSANPLSNAEKSVFPVSPTYNEDFRRSPPPIRINKQSRVFGTSVGDTGGTLESKLTTLRDMGFPDDKRNATVLKGLNGNLERTVESLVRLGEGSRPTSRSRSPVPSKTTPTTAKFPDHVENPKSVGRSTNPFDPPATAQENQRVIGLSFEQPAQQQQQPPSSFVLPPADRPASYNPFDAPSQPPVFNHNLEQSFQNLQLSQPLFPNSTGGYPSQPPQMPQARFQQSMTPPVPLEPSQFGFTASPPPINGNYNPFFQSIHPLQNVMNNSYTPQAPMSPSTNPFLGQNNTFNSTTPLQSLPESQPVQFQQSQPYAEPQGPYNLPPQQQPLHQPFNPAPAVSNPPNFQSFYQSQPQSLHPQQTGRIDKGSILALYSYPQLAPRPEAHPMTPDSRSPDPVTSATAPSTVSQPQRSVTMLVSAGNRNPFLRTNGGAEFGVAPPPIGIARHASQESVDIAGFQSGRHSPDAFASLSARYVR